jgi:Glycosyl transferase family 2
VIEAVGVVVPAHNEEELLPQCLTALRRAAGALTAPVRLLVTADSCTDRTAAVARGHRARVIDVRARSVGAARAAGMAELLRLTAGSDPAAVWLATTDADTVVPPGWLRRQLAYANQGWDLVLGTVTVADWDEHPPHMPAVFEARYRFGAGPHPHVHGANLGLRASAYLAAGGFRPLRTAEDHALLAAATEAGCRILRASDIAVTTSARRQARAPHGFSQLLRSLAETLLRTRALPETGGLEGQVTPLGDAGGQASGLEVVGGRRLGLAGQFLQVRAGSEQPVMAGHPLVGGQPGQDLQPGGRAVHHGQGHRAVEGGERVGRGQLEQVIKGQDLRPVGIGHAFGLVVHGGDGSTATPGYRAGRPGT